VSVVCAQLRRRRRRCFAGAAGQVSRLTTPQAFVVTEARRGLQLQVTDGSPRRRGVLNVQRILNILPDRRAATLPIAQVGSGANEACHCSDRCRNRAPKRAFRERHREREVAADVERSSA
jgi:hypothetical protein